MWLWLHNPCSYLVIYHCLCLPLHVSAQVYDAIDHNAKSLPL
jgi:hypothetical protein